MLKILYFRTDRFGEFILNLPAIKALKKSFKDSYVAVVARPELKQLIQNSPFIDEVIPYDGKREQKGPWHTIKFISMIHKKRFDLAIISNPAKKLNIIAFLAGIPKRAGYDRKWGFLLTDKIKDKKFLGLKHEVEYNLDLVRAIGAKDTQDKNLSLPLTDFELQFAKSELEKNGLKEGENIIAIHPWSSNPAKQWPCMRFAQLADKLVSEVGAKVIIIGGKEKIAHSVELLRSIKNKCFDFTGKTSLRQLAALLKNCRLLVSGDSGPVHIAACVNTPVIALFGTKDPATGPKRWGPWGKGHIVIHKEKLEDIAVEEVFQEISDKVS
jgi:lipopolysaccharide heptosyltransferase II